MVKAISKRKCMRLFEWSRRVSEEDRVFTSFINQINFRISNSIINYPTHYQIYHRYLEFQQHFEIMPPAWMRQSIIRTFRKQDLSIKFFPSPFGQGCLVKVHTGPII